MVFMVSIMCDINILSTRKVFFFWMFWIFITWKMIIQVYWNCRSNLSSLSLFRVLEKIRSCYSKYFFLCNIIWYVFQLFTLVLVSTLDFTNVQNYWKWIKTIKSNPVSAKICLCKTAFISVVMSAKFFS